MTTPIIPFTPLRRPQQDEARAYLENGGFPLFFYMQLGGSFERASILERVSRCDRG